MFALVLGYWLAIIPRGISIGDGFKFLAAGFSFGLLFLLPGRNERNYSFFGHLQIYPFVAFGMAAFFLVGTKREELSRRVTEGDLFLLTLSLLYLISPMRLDHKIIGVLAILPSIVVLYFAFTRDSLGRLDQLFFGIWSLVISAIFCLEQIVPSLVTLVKANDQSVLEFDELFDLFATLILAGMTFVYLCSALVPIIKLLRDKHENRQDYDRRMKEDALPFLRARVLSTQVPVRVILFILLVHGGPLLLNYRYEFVSYPLALGYALIFSPLVTFGLANRLFPSAGISEPGTSRTSR